MYCLSDAAGRYLADLTADGPTLSLIAADALVSRFAWISSTRAVEALHQAQASGPGQQPLIDGCGAISAWLLHEAMRAELGQ